MNKYTYRLLLLAGTSMACIASGFAQTGYISTFAGTGATGYTGDGGPCAEARLNTAVDVAIDGLHNVYIADIGSNVIRMVNSAGIITTIAGGDTSGYSGDGGPATLALLNQPSGIAADYEGNLYVADQGNNVIRKVSTTGVITTVAGNGAGAGGGFGFYYSGDGGPATAAELSHPEDIAIDPAGNIYIADEYNSVVRKVDPSGIITTVAGIADSFAFGGDGGPATAAKFKGVNGVAVDNSGNVYISDQNNYAIRKVNTSGIITTIAGTPGVSGYSGDGGPATAAAITGIGLTLDDYGNLYFSTGFAIRKIDPSGIITRVAGNDTTLSFSGGFGGDFGPATAARLNEAIGMAFDASGVMYIADAYNARIRRVTDNNPLEAHSMPNAVSSVTLYPDPNHGAFVVKASLNNDIDGMISMQVTDMLGRVVYHGFTLAKQGAINAEIQLDDHLPRGMYVLDMFVNDASGNAESGRFNFRFTIE